MFNKRWKRVVLWTLSILVVLGIGGLFAANYAVDKLMNSMVGGFDVEAENTAIIDNSQVVGTAPADTSIVSTPTPVPLEVGEDVQADDSQNKEEAAGDKAATDTSKSTSAPSTDKTTTNGYTAQVSTDKAKEIQDKVTVKEKADVASIVLGQLSVADINRLQDLASGGLTLDEKKEARSIILDKVSEEQYNELSQIAKKYGVSQGKTRDQILAEENGSE
ncbi:MAG: hypothetical protein K6T94_17765 [Paenibacillus sp.]|nr:hypothetical protein [Paenibacillus sp.]